MQDPRDAAGSDAAKHEQLGEFGAIPGAPNGPPIDLSQSRKDAENGKETTVEQSSGANAETVLPSSVLCDSAPLREQNTERAQNSSECAQNARENSASEKLTPIPAVLCASAPLREAEKDAQKCAFSYTCAASLEVHELAHLFPPMSDTEFADFKADIAKNGVTDPLWIFEGKVLDGRNRLRACKELNIDPPTLEWNGEGSPLDFVVSRNLHRRHLNETQRAMVAARLIPALQKASKERSLADKDLDKVANLPPCKSRDQAGRLLNISPRSVQHALLIVSKGCPELIALVDRSEIPVSKAATIAALPYNHQCSLLKERVAVVLQIARELEEEARDRRRKKKFGDEAPPEPPKTLDFGLVEAKFDGKRYRIEVGDDWPEILKRAVADWTGFDRAIDYGGIVIVKKKMETKKDVA